MLDFLKIATRSPKRGTTEVYPTFKVKKSSDLMIRGGDFYAVWVEDLGLWSTDEDDLIQLVDRELKVFADNYKSKTEDVIKIQFMESSESGMIDNFHRYCQRQMRDSFKMLDEKLIFSNTETTKKDYASKKLPYPLEPGETPSYERLISTLYTEEERHKLEWAIGAVISGDSKKIQKFLVLYGAAGTGKSTILNIIQQLFEGYYSVFDARALGSSSNSFALEAFKTNPLVAIQHDGDLSKIEDNTRLNSLVSHELMTVNEKFKSAYANRFKAFLFMGTNKPVKITDGKSGLLRRLIDVSPSGNKVPAREYKKLVKQVVFELGGIATHCHEVYLDDPGRYDDYVPITMLGASNDFYNFIIDSYHIFKREDGTTLKAAWEMYKLYCDDAKVPYPFSQRTFKEELKNYFWDFKERFTSDDGSRIRSYYTGFRTDKFDDELDESKPAKKQKKEETKEQLIQFDSTKSIFDTERADCLAQYASSEGTPQKKWASVKTKLSELDTSQLHYVKVPENHIVIDFDIKGTDGKKSFEKNLEAASKWPATYAELSKSGAGIHLHYIYSGDVSRLSRIYAEDIEVKVFTGKSSLRRKLTKCNNLPIATISSGLPLKEGEKVINKDAVQTEKGLRTTINKCLLKEVHGSTRPNVDFIYEILERAYTDGLKYDVSDLKNDVFAFAAQSSHQAAYCLKVVNKMHFKSDEPSINIEADSDSLVFYDVEVFPNLFLVNYKLEGKDKPVVRLINPTPSEIEELIRFKLVGFNCRRYDNHILYGCLIGYDNQQLYDLSQKIINSKKGDRNNGMFGEAYNISYTDVYDFAATKQSLKKWEIELGIHHQELGLPWDQPVPEEMWNKVAEYCDNDVIATEAVFNHLKADFLARQILADVAGMTVNDTTNSLTTRIIFEGNRKPQDQFEYRDIGDASVIHNWTLTEDMTMYANFGDDYTAFDDRGRPIFPGYKYDHGVSTYRGEEVGEGGYVYAEPGIYGNVALLDIASMHPSSIVAENLFGDVYTQRFKDILEARIAIKHKDFDHARKMLNGALVKYLDDESKAGDLAQALKIAINSVYGLTSANFDNPFRDRRNKDNIVAKRGALFMVNLKHEVQKRGFVVAHVKTDSIKIPDATPEIIQFVMDYGQQYGYTFEHEETYDRMCLVNDAVYIAKYSKPHIDKKTGEEIWWTATGTQFAVPYIFKKLFSGDPIEFEDLCETKSVSTALYLDTNEGLPDVSELEKEREALFKKISDPKQLGENMDKECARVEELSGLIEQGHKYRFVGKVGSFCPIKPGRGGGELLREGKDKEGNLKYASATGAKGYRWLEAEMVSELGKEGDIDYSYYDKLLNDAVDNISKYGDFEWFVSEDPYIGPEYDSTGRPVYGPIEDELPPWDETTPFDVR